VKAVMDLYSTLSPIQRRLHETAMTETILNLKNPGNENLAGQRKRVECGNAGGGFAADGSAAPAAAHSR